MNRALSRRGILSLAALLPALALAFGTLLAGSRPALAEGVAPAVGKAAPAFKLQDQAGKWHSLADYKGKWVALYFYPKDDTPGCTTQACGFRDNYLAIEEKHAVVLGISPDDEKSHVKFKTKFNLPFTLLSDVDHAVAEAYGVWGEKSMMGKKYMGIIRSHFIVDENGRLIDVQVNIKPEACVAGALEVISRESGAAS